MESTEKHLCAACGRFYGHPSTAMLCCLKVTIRDEAAVYAREDVRCGRCSRFIPRGFEIVRGEFGDECPSHAAEISLNKVGAFVADEEFARHSPRAIAVMESRRRRQGISSIV